MYQERERNQAVVHLHSTHSVAVSVLEGLDPDDLLPPLTAYYVMRIGTLPLVPYYAPGDMALAEAVRGYAGKHHAVLLANHGPVVAGSEPRGRRRRGRGAGSDREAVPAAAGPARAPAHARPGRRHPQALSRGLGRNVTSLTEGDHCARQAGQAGPERTVVGVIELKSQYGLWSFASF